MSDILQDVITFLENTQTNAKGVTFRRYNLGHLKSYGTKPPARIEKVFANKIETIEKECGVTFSLDDRKLPYIHSVRFFWQRPEQFHKEGFLQGGFFLCGLTDLFLMGRSDFYTPSLTHFLCYETTAKTDVGLIESVEWIESPVNPLEGEYIPLFGCVKLEKGKFPNQFYFYDSGIIYPLPFKSYKEYLTAMINSACVVGWQYFYVPSDLIVKLNEGLHYITWARHTTTSLGEEYGNLNPIQNPLYDRLDMINDSLERSARLLPQTFPFIDFSHHISYYEKFKQLYEESKK